MLGKCSVLCHIPNTSVFAFLRCSLTNFHLGWSSTCNLGLQVCTTMPGSIFRFQQISSTVKLQCNKSRTLSGHTLASSATEASRLAMQTLDIYTALWTIQVLSHCLALPCWHHGPLGNHSCRH
jgi:hypothetical protein